MGLIKTTIIAGTGIYAVNKITKAAENRRTTPAPVAAVQDSNYSRQQQVDAPPSYYPVPYQQAGPSQEKVVPMEFQYTERRGPQQDLQQQQKQQGHAQVLSANNSAYAPLPYGYDNHQPAYEYAPEHADMYAAGSAPLPQYDSWRQRRHQQGFVEPDEVSNSTTFDGQPSRRGNTGRTTGLLDTLAQQAENLRDGKGKDIVGKLLSR
ncbi:uncharacterized protein Z520_00694 [Fonsecaea multimorphosa CBS 102226]|uniref:Uncharacterized protein n=1 Tax=Fonsecaea multimorphosa CBS 102226 TaxID=1442371 RepID=A0A0D2J3P4_9EURO|nr:uncharacterized protein Z520_00694 [Fonsecaea multimorphosa CBS 102226]KIY04002.1 hypothetical protein Z520_00694 [Fonsecaea multimorphosa CBS 102226]OAL31840.1 hypothetical protein AYO22_00710 [Fonsecaea multimorphosa]